VLELDCALEFDARCDGQFFAALPNCPGVFQVEPRAELVGAQPYLLRTADLRARLMRLLGLPDPSTKRLNLREFAARVRWRATGSKLEQSLALWQHMRALYPQKYRARMRLRPAALLKVNLRNDYPRCYVTRRVLSDGGFYFGPFAGRRSAEAFAERFLDLFKVRRCQIKIRRDPSFPGCIYSEMKMCLAPCFAGCTKGEYDVEVGRVVGFLDSSGASLSSELEREREQASEQLDYERAAALHRRIEKVSEVLRGWPGPARRIAELNAVIVERAAEPNAVALFTLRGGIIADPFVLRFDEIAMQPRSLDAILKENLEPAVQIGEHSLEAETKERVIPSEAGNPSSWLGGGQQAAFVPSARAAAALEDHLALLARWYYAKPRSGEIFFRAPGNSAQSGWPYRRIVRACSRILKESPSVEGPKS